ncbi:hypothetical protein BSSX_4290 [Bacillus subtilis]|nr:hypothetical protein BSSX_4290 [Bacillus subtilis]
MWGHFQDNLPGPFTSVFFKNYQKISKGSGFDELETAIRTCLSM